MIANPFLGKDEFIVDNKIMNLCTVRWRVCFVKYQLCSNYLLVSGFSKDVLS